MEMQEFTGFTWHLVVHVIGAGTSDISDEVSIDRGSPCMF